MILDLYGFGEVHRNAVPWVQFRAAFGGCHIKPDPNEEREGHWILENPVRNIRFYAVVDGGEKGQTSAVHFEYADVKEFQHENGCPHHPFWKGLFSLLRDWRLLLHVQPPGAGTPVAEAVVVAQPHLLQELPSWVQDDVLRFVAPSAEQFDAVIAAGWDLSRRYLTNSRKRVGWADASERDEQALAAFRNFFQGKRGSRVRYAWLDKPVKVAQSSGAFLDVYGTWVDWHDLDDSVARYFGDALKEELQIEYDNEHLRIGFQGRTTNLSIDDIGTNRYNTIRAVNGLLSPQYEIRVVPRTTDGDTHCFLLAPRWLWDQVEKHCGEQVMKKVRLIEPTDTFD